MCFGLPPATIRARCECMYSKAENCFVRSGVMKMPLITTSQRLAPSAGRSPANEEKTNVALPPICPARSFAKSMSKPVGFPPAVEFSIGGKDGLSQYLNEVPHAALRSSGSARDERSHDDCDQTEQAQRSPHHASPHPGCGRA